LQIECVWHELKHYLRGHVMPVNKKQLIEGIQTFWRTRMTVAKCRKYIKHIDKVMPCVIARAGQGTLY
jgi:hypothetical protein